MQSKNIMKKIIVVFFLFIAATVSAQNTPPEDTTGKPAITGIGKPDGEKTEMKIGKEGGSFASADGKVKLIIPEGAVSKNTTFSIQPITNLAPNGSGKSYEMEPAGINFKKPLQIIFYYAGTETEGYSRELLGIAIQDDKGQWSSPDKTRSDSVEKTLAIETWHFSRFVLYYSAYISPASARVKVKGSLRLKIIGVLNIDYGRGGPLIVRTESAEIWSVNGIPKGNNKVGLISASQDYSAIYQAPALVPLQNPVAVTVKENFYGAASGKYDAYTLVSNILVYDNAYEVTMATSSRGSAGSQLGFGSYKDAGSFVVSLESGDAKIIEKLNNNQEDELGYKGKCLIVLLKSGTGNIHITGVNSIRVIPPASPYGNPWVEIIFKRTPTEFSLLKITCPPIGKGGPTTGTNAQANAMVRMLPALPQVIKFEAKEGEQTILEIGKEGGEIFTKFTVKQLKDD
jgi:hypothetical protein